MINAIDSKYCKDNLVQFMSYTNLVQLIVSPEEIILFKIGGNVIVNKYSNHPSRNLFPYSDKEQIDYNHITELFEYNKTYLDFMCSSDGFGMNEMSFYKGTEGALCFNAPLNLDDRRIEQPVTRILTRKEVEDIFNSDNYDSMYILNGNGRIHYASNKNDGISIGKKVIPSDDEIVEDEYQKRLGYCKIARAINGNLSKPKEEIKKKNIDGIENFKLYAPFLFRQYIHLMLTSKNGEFELKWFRLDFVKKDQFKLTTSPIKIYKPSVEEIVDYATNNQIEFTPKPVDELENGVSKEDENAKILSIIKEVKRDQGY